MEYIVAEVNKIKEIEKFDLTGAIDFKLAVNNIYSLLTRGVYKTWKENDTFMDTVFDFHNFSISCYGPFNKYKYVHRNTVKLMKTIQSIKENLTEDFLLELVKDDIPKTLNKEMFVRSGQYGSDTWENFIKTLDNFLESAEIYQNINKEDMFIDYLRCKDKDFRTNSGAIILYDFDTENDTCDITSCYLEDWTFSYSETISTPQNMYKEKAHQEMTLRYYPEYAL